MPVNTTVRAVVRSPGEAAPLGVLCVHVGAFTFDVALKASFDSPSTHLSGMSIKKQDTILAMFFTGFSGILMDYQYCVSSKYRKAFELHKSGAACFVTLCALVFMSRSSVFPHRRRGTEVSIYPSCFL